MAGVFYAVIFGLVLSLFTLFFELAWASRKDKNPNQVEHLCFSHLVIYVIYLCHMLRSNSNFYCIYIICIVFITTESVSVK